MNIHKNARLTFTRRLEMVQDVTECKLTYAAAAAKHQVSVPSVRKWVGRYLMQGEPGLRDASSRPQVSPRAIAPSCAIAFLRASVTYFASRSDQTGTHRQWLRLSLQALRRCLPPARSPAQLHSPLSAADQWQGRALHPIRSARMGVWHSLSTLRGTHRDAAAVEPSLQLASPASRHRRDRTHDSPQSDQKQTC